jgi:hypothetical protein
MATTHSRGYSARILFTPPDEAEETFLLAVPLWDLDPVDAGARYDWWSWNRKHRETVLVGDGVEEMFGSIRFDDQPVLLKRMLRLALRHNLDLNYQKTDGGVVYPLKLVAVVGATSQDMTPIFRDPQRTAQNAWASRGHFRRIDGGTLDGLL